MKSAKKKHSTHTVKTGKKQQQKYGKQARGRERERERKRKREC